MCIKNCIDRRNDQGKDVYGRKAAGSVPDKMCIRDRCKRHIHKGRTAEEFRYPNSYFFTWFLGSTGQDVYKRQGAWNSREAGIPSAISGTGTWNPYYRWSYRREGSYCTGSVSYTHLGKVKNKGVWEIDRNEIFTPLRRKFHKGVKVFYAADSAWRTQGQAGKYLHAGEKTAVQDADKLSL